MVEDYRNNRLLASLAVFRELHAQGKSLNEILSEFLIEIIKSKRLYQFTASEMIAHLDELFDFQIPEAVITTSLKKIDFLTLSYHKYNVADMSKLDHYSLAEQENEIQTTNEKIVNNLLTFISDYLSIVISATEEKKILKAFTNFILDNTIDNGYSDLISAFILKNETDPEFIKQLQTIKEGVILYTGLKYNSNIGSNSSWRSKLTIYLNTEILFHAFNLNGELYKTLFDDFYSLVKEINKKDKYIYLKYFKESTEEINSFFLKAESIVEGKSQLDPSTVAMSQIVNGCKDSMHVMAKKHDFFSFLNTNGIFEEDEEDIYKEENYQYYILSKELLTEQIKNGSIEDIEIYLKFLNYTSVKRGNKESANFENIGYILLTENRKINAIAWSDEIKKVGSVPLATNMQFLTNKFWFKLNKGFGNEDYPVSFKVITKAQILLSSHLNEKISKQYHNLQERIEKHELSKESATSILYELRERTKLPEELAGQNMNEVLHTISTEDLEMYASEHTYIKQKAIEQSKENAILIETLNKTQLKNNEILNLAKDRTLGLLETKIKNLEYIEATKKRLDTQAENEYNGLKKKILLSVLIYYSLILFAIYKFGWGSMEGAVWILTFVLPFAASFVYVFFTEKNFDLIEFLKEKRENVINNLYVLNDLNIVEIEELKAEIEVLRQEIS